MSWTNKTQIVDAVSVSGVEVYSDAVTLNPGELAVVQVDANFTGSPTDDLLIKVYGTLDDSSENWDDTPVYQFAVDKDTDPNAVTFNVSCLYKFRLGLIRDGSTDTIVVDAYYRRDGVSL